jgi:hypothetical protein
MLDITLREFSVKAKLTQDEELVLNKIKATYLLP